MEVRIKEQIERMKVLAELWFNEGKKVFIKDIKDNYYFADIIIVGEDTILIECFSPRDRIGKREQLYWANIRVFEEYRGGKNDLGN